MKNLKLKRKDNEEVFVTKKLGWKFHHMGIPTRSPIENERYIPHLKIYDFRPHRFVELSFF